MLKDHKALELDKILLQLANETTCPDAAELAQKIEPDTDIRHVERLLQETDDAFVLMAKYGAPSFYGMTNVTNALRRAEAGGVLNLAELLSVAATLRAIRSVSDWRKKSESVKTALDYRFETLQPNKFIEDRISMTVVSEEEVADTASVALAAIRRKIRAASLRVREQLDKMIRSQTYQKYLQEAIVTQRGGRYVVPVKAEFRNEVKGLIHDSSGSGATVFIEPIGVVEANNEIRVLRSDEKDEIDRIAPKLMPAVTRDIADKGNAIAEHIDDDLAGDAAQQVMTLLLANFTLPLLGEIHFASALFFDAGVFAAVVGSTLLILTALAHQSVRSHRKAPEKTVTATTGPREVD